MEFKGTKGEWAVDNRATLRVQMDSKTIANCSSGQSGDNFEEEQANAKLISAAPELLEAIQLIIEYHSHAESIPGNKIGNTRPFVMAKKAINKALK